MQKHNRPTFTDKGRLKTCSMLMLLGKEWTAIKSGVHSLSGIDNSLRENIIPILNGIDTSLKDLVEIEKQKLELKI
jgi:hypothetical protein